jgi:hypothetical protein
MPGQPKTNEMLQTIEASGGAEWLLSQVSEGKTLISLARDLGVSRSIVSGLLNRDEHKEALKNARMRGATALAEQSVEIADQATSETERVDRLRVDVRRWLSSKWDRETYGDRTSPMVQIKMATLHIDALRRFGQTPASAPSALQHQTGIEG